jgi:superfamily II DNA/RNA helicase
MEKIQHLSFKSYFYSEQSKIINRDILNDLVISLKYEYPSNIQELILQNLISENTDSTINNNNNNILCSAIKAETGTGKTLSYLIKLCQSIDFSRKNEIQAIIITPTRELSLQTEEYISKIKNMKYKILIGGKANIPGKIKKEKIDKNNIPTVIVGTLGKLREVLLNKKFKKNKKGNNYINNIKCIVIDEADKMMDQNKPPMNLLETFLNFLFKYLFNDNQDKNNIYKQLILCSASFNEKTELFYTNIISRYINNKNNNNKIFTLFSTSNYNEINNNKENDNENIVNDNIKEYIINFYEKKHESFYEQKYKTLIILLSSLQKKYNQCLIFYNKKNKGEELSQDLRNYGFSVCFIHGQLNQDERQLIYCKIKNLEYKIILSTDLLSRGIDLTAVNLVINFDEAFDNIEHNHRVGRTGRFFEKGVVISFCENKNMQKNCDNNGFDEKEIEKVIKIVENEFITSERLSKEEIDKINKGQNKNDNILKEALTEVIGINVLLQKKRKL